MSRVHSEAGYESSQTFNSQPLESPSPMVSPRMTPVPHHFNNSAKMAGADQNDNSKRISDCGYPATAIKVDLPYQSYLNHPFTKLQQPSQQQQLQQPHSQVQKPQAYINKYNNYTNSSKSIRLITIPSTSSALFSIEKSKMNNLSHGGLMSALDSPTSPMVSPPPPYLHSDHGDSGFNSTDSKKQNNNNYSPGQPQWPSMMMLSSAAGVTTTAATVTRPKLARVLPPQAIPIVTSGPGIGISGRGLSSADAIPLTSTTPRASRPNMMMDDVQMSEECLVTYHAGSSSSAAVTGQQMNLRATSSPLSLSFPGFWEEARQSKMHYIFLSFGVVMMGSAIWVLAMQVFLLEWAMVMPAASLVLFGMQYGRYRWKRNRHYHQIKRNGEASASSAITAAAAAAAHLSSLALSSSPRESDAYLEPHQPRNFYAAAAPPPHHHHVTFQEQQQQQQPQLQFNQQAYQQPRMSKKQHHSQYRPSSPTTLSSSSSSSSLSSSTGSLSSLGYKRPTITAPSAIVNNGSPFYQNHQFLSPVESPITPPPAYFLKKIELPEIRTVVGDLVSEFEIDFSSIKY